MIATPPIQRSLVPPILGFYSRLFLVTMLVFGLGGVAWGWWRPTVTGVISDQDGIEFTDPEQVNASVEFVSFAGLAGLCLFLGIAVASYAVVRGQRFVGPLTMLVTAAMCWIGSLLSYSAGTFLANQLVTLPDTESLAVGTAVTFVPSISPGMAMLVAPAVAIVSYWVIVLLSREA
ncbi:hypothetical protein [Corynebacterium epidermidicanis]|uniref:DUF2567 family protein n=1 Tax=Corynebacterium epidermidicanis TaxID=1050174 RepID=A0A0G3GVB6_9CORY|nr:hypothetical protein [Corynebacterium epidermidicanis]AKK03478.1 hypothetical protein CEPID_08140 [Corynebacterium epidermidicanis]